MLLCTLHKGRIIRGMDGDKLSESAEQPQEQPVAQSTSAEQLEQERQERIEYLRSVAPQPKKPKRKWPKVLTWTLLALVLLGGIGGGVYWQFFRNKPATTTQTPTTESNTQAPTNNKIATATKHHDSTNFSLSFDYPEDWTVTDEDGDMLTVTSPTLQLKDATGESVNGQIVLTITQKGQKLQAFEEGNATAVRKSEKIAYTKPTPAQRANTYLSFLRYATTASTDTLDGIYITGDYGYQVDQAIPKVDAAKLDPLVTVTFKKCSNNTCDTAEPLGVASSSWDDAAFATPIKKMLKSLTFN